MRSALLAFVAATIAIRLAGPLERRASKNREIASRARRNARSCGTFHFRRLLRLPSSRPVALQPRADTTGGWRGNHSTRTARRLLG